MLKGNFLFSAAMTHPHEQVHISWPVFVTEIVHPANKLVPCLADRPHSAEIRQGQEREHALHDVNWELATTSPT